MTAESGRRASRLELIRARLHDSRGRCPRDGDAAAPTPTTSVRHDVRPSPSTATHNGIRPAPDRRGGGRVDSKSDRTVRSGSAEHDRQVAAGRLQTEVRGRSKLDAGDDGQVYAQVRKPAPADRGPTAAEGAEGRRPTQDRDDSSVSAAAGRRQKTSSSSSLLSRSQNFFARLRSRKNDPTKSACADAGGGSGNVGDGSNRKIRRSVSDSGCAMYANRELVGDVASPSSAHLDAVTSSRDVTTERRTAGQVDGPEADGRDVAANATTASVYAEVEPPTSRRSTSADVTESTSGAEQADSCPMSTAVYEECAGSYSLREALLQRGGDAAAAAAVTETPTSETFSHVIRRDSDDDERVPPRRAQTTSLLPLAAGVASGGGRSGTATGWRRRKLSSSQSSGCVLGGRRDGRLLERIQEVDSPPGSADDDVTSRRSPPASNSVAAEQRVGLDATTPGSDARNRKFIG